MQIRRSERANSRIHPTSVALVVLLLAAFVLRVYRLDWDEGHYLHPDERHIANTINDYIILDWPPDLDNLRDPAVSHLNPRSNERQSDRPHNFPYGALPLLITELIAESMSALTGDDWTSYYGRVYQVGRALSAFFDTATVLLIYLIGARVANRRVGLLAGTVAALTPMSIQLAHFFTTDSWLTFFVALTLLLAIYAAEEGDGRWFVAAGASFGLAMATKGSVFTLAGVIAVAVALDAYRRWSTGASVETSLIRMPINLLIAGLTSIAAFALFEPYALARPVVYMDQLREQSEIIRGIRDYPYTRQYIGTPPVLYQIEQVVRWGFGPVAGILSLSGIALLALRCLRRRSLGLAVLLSWIVGYGLVIAVVETKFLRYLAPLVPVLAFTAAVAFDAIWSWLRQRNHPRIAASLGVAMLVGMVLWTAAYTSIFAVDHPRIAASKWIYANVPPGSTVSAESWDDPLPMGLAPGLTGDDFQYSTFWFDMYGDRPPAEMAEYLYSSLQQLDFVILSSNRVSSAMPQSPWRYAVQQRYYELLDSGQLGFDRIAEFNRYPGIGDWRIPDQNADESFTNYDHPRVVIYQKSSLVPRQVYDELMSWTVAQPHSPTRHAPEKSLRLDEPVGELAVVNDARWSSALTDNSLVALLVWVALLVVLQIASWPLTALLFRRFADGGWGLGRLLTLLIAGYLVWLLASVEVIAFRALWSAVAVVALGGVWLVWWRRNSRTTRPFPIIPRRNAFATECAFWSVFVLFLLFRYLNPDSWHPFWGGEKPMEFAHINALLRSPHFPPYDPWFSDGYINYYYYGLYLVAFCFKLTGIPSEIAFNLAQPTMMALLASAVFSLASTIGRDLVRHRALAIPAGILGVIFTVLIGNLDSFVRFVRAIPQPTNPTFEWTWNATRVINPPFDTITEFPYFTGLYADLHAHVVALPITVLAIALCYSIAKQPRLLAIALHRRGAREARTAVLMRGGALALTLGTLSVTNAWDVPVYLALVAVAIFMAGSMVRSLFVRIGIAGVGAATIGAVGYVLFLPFFQYYVALFSSLGRVRTKTSFWEFGDHLGGLLTILFLGLTVASLWARSGSRPPLPHPLIPIAGVSILLLLRLAFVDGSDPFAETLTRLIVVVLIIMLTAVTWSIAKADRSRFSAFGQVVGILSAIAAIAALVSDRPVLATGLAFAGPSAALWICSGDRAIAFVGALATAASLVVAGVEIVYVVDDLSGGSAYRMNTVFKFYNQAWILLAICSAAFTALMVDRLPWTRIRDLIGEGDSSPVSAGFIARLSPLSIRSATESESDALTHRSTLVNQWAVAGVALTIAVVVMSSFYPLLATRPRLEQRFTTDLGSGTLNALDWMNDGTISTATGEIISFRGDRAAIDWLNSHVTGSPVLAEASLPPYRGNGSRISIGTGLPTIMGWERHQYQQRYPEGIAQRTADVQTLYDSADPAVKLEILRRYNVEYVIVGDVERNSLINDLSLYASPEGIAAFGGMVGASLEIVFESDRTLIYHVLPAGT